MTTTMNKLSIKTKYVDDVTPMEYAQVVDSNGNVICTLRVETQRNGSQYVSFDIEHHKGQVSEFPLDKNGLISGPRKDVRELDKSMFLTVAFTHD